MKIEAGIPWKTVVDYVPDALDGDVCAEVVDHISDEEKCGIGI